jgi:hypothetical protein
LEGFWRYVLSSPSVVFEHFLAASILGCPRFSSRYLVPHKEKKLKTTGGAPVIWYWQSRGFYVQDTQKTNHNGAATQHHKGIPVTSLETIDHPSANE